MNITVTLYNDNLQPVSKQTYELDSYLHKLKNRVISILYRIENGVDKDNIQLFIKKIYYEMNSIDELSKNTLFFSSMCNIHSVGTMIDLNESYKVIRSSILEIANNILRVGGV